LLYTGKYGVQTEANGLLNMRARFYHPQLGRFCNADPIGFAGGLNLYAAFENNPVNKIDPRGLLVWHIVGAIAGGGLDLGVQLIQNGGSFSKVNWTSVAVSTVAGVAGVGLGGQVAKLTTSLAARPVMQIATRAVLNGAGSAVIGAGGQMVNNAVDGEKLGTNVGKAAALSGTFGAAGSVAGDLVERIVASALKPNAYTQSLIDSGALQAGEKPLLLPGDVPSPTLGSQLGVAAGTVTANLTPVVNLADNAATPTSTGCHK